jgi:hypothetical protein
MGWPVKLGFERRSGCGVGGEPPALRSLRTFCKSSEQVSQSKRTNRKGRPMITYILCTAYFLFFFGYTLYSAYYVIFHICLRREDELPESRPIEARRDLPLDAGSVVPRDLLRGRELNIPLVF